MRPVQSALPTPHETARCRQAPCSSRIPARESVAVVSERADNDSIEATDLRHPGVMSKVIRQFVHGEGVGTQVDFGVPELHRRRCAPARSTPLPGDQGPRRAAPDPASLPSLATGRSLPAYSQADPASRAGDDSPRISATRGEDLPELGKDVGAPASSGPAMEPDGGEGGPTTVDSRSDQDDEPRRAEPWTGVSTSLDPSLWIAGGHRHPDNLAVRRLRRAIRPSPPLRCTRPSNTRRAARERRAVGRLGTLHAGQAMRISRLISNSFRS